MGSNQRRGKREEGRTSEKSEEKERDQGAEGETLYSRPSDRYVKRGKVTERKTEEEQKERNRKRAPNPATPDHLVASYDPHGSYSGPLFNLFIYMCKVTSYILHSPPYDMIKISN